MNKYGMLWCLIYFYSPDLFGLASSISLVYQYASRSNLLCNDAFERMGCALGVHKKKIFIAAVFVGASALIYSGRRRVAGEQKYGKKEGYEKGKSERDSAGEGISLEPLYHDNGNLVTDETMSKPSIIACIKIHNKRDGPVIKIPVRLCLYNPVGRIMEWSGVGGCGSVIDPGVIEYLTAWPAHLNVPTTLVNSGESLTYHNHHQKRQVKDRMHHVWSRHPVELQAWLYCDIFDRNCAFEYALRLSEQDFRDTCLQGVKWPCQDVFELCKWPKSVAASPQCDLVKQCARTFKCLSIEEAEKNAAGMLEDDAAKTPGKRGRLVMLQTSVDGDAATRIECLQERFGVAKESGVRAAFQIASTSCCLGVGMMDNLCLLNAMSLTPGQGEDASLCTMPAVIARRYGIPLKDRTLLYGSGLDDKGKTNCSIGVHHNVPVTAGYLGPLSIPCDATCDTQRKFDSVPAFGKQLKHPVYVHHLLTAAVDLSAYLKKACAIRQKAYDVLADMYRGTFLTAFALFAGQLAKAWEKDDAGYVTSNIKPGRVLEALQNSKIPTIFITLLGAGASRNDLASIVTAIEDSEQLITHYGLQVCLVLRDITPAGTKQFEKNEEAEMNRRLTILMNRINNKGEQ